MKEKSKERKFFVRVDGKQYHTRYVRRFLRHTRTIIWKKGIVVYVKVTYEDGGYNDGEYTDKEEFTKAVNAFLE